MPCAAAPHEAPRTCVWHGTLAPPPGRVHFSVRPGRSAQQAPAPAYVRSRAPRPPRPATERLHHHRPRRPQPCPPPRPPAARASRWCQPARARCARGLACGWCAASRAASRAPPPPQSSGAGGGRASAAPQLARQWPCEATAGGARAAVHAYTLDPRTLPQGCADVTYFSICAPVLLNVDRPAHVCLEGMLPAAGATASAGAPAGQRSQHAGHVWALVGSAPPNGESARMPRSQAQQRGRAQRACSVAWLPCGLAARSRPASWPWP